jgi:putative membrane protein
MPHDRFRKALLTGALLSLGCAVPLASQALSHGERTPSSTSATSASPAASPLSQGDRRFIEKAARGGMAEVELGQLAEQRAHSPKVKAFGRRMVHDHSGADNTLDQMASSKGVTIPAGLDKASQRQYDRLEKLSGARFDREYMAMMVSEHKKDISAFKKEQRSAKDSDVKNFARTTLPTLEEHLTIAKADRASIRSENPSGAISKSTAAPNASAHASPSPSGREANKG